MKKGTEASYTVEAAILTPIILAVIIAMIQICFICHDRVVLREALEYAAFCITSGQRIILAFDAEGVTEEMLLSEVTENMVTETSGGIVICAKMVSRRLVPLYFPGGGVTEREESVNRKKTYGKEKTIISEVLLDTFHVME